jgi:hypothetical protein
VGRRDKQARKAALKALRKPVCWSWEITEEVLHAAYLARSRRDAVAVLEEWQHGLCAVCGQFLALVLDHDHETMEIRGLLCEPCNMREGFNWELRVMILYRRMPPAYLLDMHVRYTEPSGPSGAMRGRYRRRPGKDSTST